MLPAQDKVIAEVDALGDHWVPSFGDLEEKLPYMDACLKESLRLYPPGHVHIRESESDTILEGSFSCLNPVVINAWPLRQRCEAILASLGPRSRTGIQQYICSIEYRTQKKGLHRPNQSVMVSSRLLSCDGDTGQC